VRGRPGSGQHGQRPEPDRRPPVRLRPPTTSPSRTRALRST
jgi:hypothetical protein